MEITEPGIYQLSDAEYHGADPVPGGSLSSTGARKLLAPSCPAIYRWEADNPPAPKRVFDFGHAAHRMVLGVGPKLVVVDADSWRTKDAKERAEDARANGAVPILPPEFEQVTAMAEAIQAHPVASKLYGADTGNAEQALFWVDEPTSVWCRAKLDWLRNPGRGRQIVPDYKTCASAEPDALGKSVANFGYNLQASWYLAGLRALGYANRDTAFVFVCQEKMAPYIVTVMQLDDEAMRIGEIKMRRALQVYKYCKAEGHWPPYAEDITLVSLPPWAVREEGENLP